MEDYLEEIWLPVVGYEGIYEVSSYGRVYACGRYFKKDFIYKDQLFYKKPKNMISSFNRDGYLMCGITKDGYQFHALVHRLQAEAFIPNPNNYPQINHINPDKSYKLFSHISNFEWVTDRMNKDHALAHGILVRHAEDHHASKLSNNQARSIRNEYSKGDISKIDLAKKYNVGKHVIYNLIDRKTYSTVI